MARTSSDAPKTELQRARFDIGWKQVNRRANGGGSAAGDPYRHDAELEGNDL